MIVFLGFLAGFPTLPALFQRAFLWRCFCRQQPLCSLYLTILLVSRLLVDPDIVRDGPAAGQAGPLRRRACGSGGRAAWSLSVLFTFVWLVGGIPRAPRFILHMDWETFTCACSLGGSPTLFLAAPAPQNPRSGGGSPSPPWGVWGVGCGSLRENCGGSGGRQLPRLSCTCARFQVPMVGLLPRSFGWGVAAPQTQHFATVFKHPGTSHA